MRRVPCTLALLLAASTLHASALRAQANVPQFRGDFGLNAGTQAPPGEYAGVLYNYYNPDEIVNANGTAFHGVTINQSTIAILLQYVSPNITLFGAHYGAAVAIPWANVAIATPKLSNETKWGFSDMFVEPLNLGWHFPRVDALGTVAVYVPTGRFTAYAPNNTGLGMWAVELGSGATVYPDAAKQFNVSAYATFDMPASYVRETTMRAGDLFTLEGGVGHTLIKGFGAIGVDYYAQWKVTADHNYNLPPTFDSKDFYFGIGPEVTVPIPVVKTMPFILTFRYFFEAANRVATQGNSLYVIFTVAKPFLGH